MLITNIQVVLNSWLLSLQLWFNSDEADEFVSQPDLKFILQIVLFDKKKIPKRTELLIVIGLIVATTYEYAR